MHDLSTAFFIAYKSVTRGNKSMLVLMMLILCLSFFSTVFIPGVFSGLLDTIVNLEVDTYTSHVMIGPEQSPTPKQFIQNQTELRAELATIPGVVGTARTYLTAGSISYDPGRNGVYNRVSAQIIGVDPSESQKILTVSHFLVAGQFLSDDDTDQILLPAAVAGGYGLPEPNDLGGAKVGDKVQVVYGNGVSRTYTVKGITNILFGPALTNAYITAKEAESVLSTYDSASQILVRTTSDSNADYIKSRAEEFAPNLHVQTYLDLITAIKPVLNAFTYIALIVSVISVLVAAITIFVMIYINAVGKRRQIGILKAIGIKERVIVYSYIFQSLFYVLCGVLLGLAFVFGVVEPLLSIHPIELPFGPLALSFSVPLVMESIAGFLIAGFFSGLIPARMVARENILTAIWG
ncbi:MAG TPA: FtsX-like permease family protein [Candidatus Paceibacterota bacterium]|nr:FtsX-like permease family protein [Candidatus Paceibacterota bacterium]